MCVGYILWPESSHTDTLALRFFTANAWSSKPVGHEAVLDEFCASRYGDRAEEMKRVWRKVIPMSRLLDWGHNCGDTFAATSLAYVQHGGEPLSGAAVERWRAALADVRGVFAALVGIRWEGEAIRRDAIDLARTALDRWLVFDAQLLDRDFKAWQKGASDGADLVARAEAMARRADLMADLLALHTDYSLWESFLRLDAIEKVTNPNFPQVLFENAANSYCMSHQYELARHLYAPRAHRFAARVAELTAKGDRKTPLELEPSDREIEALRARPLESLRPTQPRTAESFRRLMLRLAQDE